MTREKTTKPKNCLDAVLFGGFIKAIDDYRNGKGEWKTCVLSQRGKSNRMPPRRLWSKQIWIDGQLCPAYTDFTRGYNTAMIKGWTKNDLEKLRRRRNRLTKSTSKQELAEFKRRIKMMSSKSAIEVIDLTSL